MSNIPEDLIADVLSRLPVKTLLRFRCVSKQWCALIDSPNFINLQLNQSLKTNTNLSVIFEFRDLLSLAFDSLEDILKDDDDDDNVIPAFKLLEKLVKLDCHPLESKDFRILGCCNGLISLLSYSTETPILLNPSTKKYQILPPVPPPSFKCRLDPVYGFELLDIVYGFGYDPVNDDYKILRVACSDDDEVPFHYEIVVYSLRSNIWRKIQPNSPRHLKYSRGGLFFNGALHWVATRQSESPVNDYIVAFDLVVENYRELQLPNISDYRSVSLGVLGGCLWLGCVYNDYPVELWVMKDYMVQESWTKHSIDLFSQVYEVPEIWKVIILAYSNSSSEVFLTEINGKLCWLHLKEQKVVDLGIRSFGAEICIASLVKLPCDQGANVL